MGTPAIAQGTLLDVQDMVTEAAPASVLAAPAMSVLSVAFQREVWPLPTAEKVTPWPAAVAAKTSSPLAEVTFTLGAVELPVAEASVPRGVV